MKRLSARHLLSVAMIAMCVAASVSAQAPLIEQGRAALGRGEGDSAIAILERAVAQYPQNAEAYYNLGNAYSSKAQAAGMLGAAMYAQKLLGAYEKAIALNPKYVEARFSLVQLYAYAPPMMGGSDEKALDQAKAIKGIDPVVGHRAYAVIYAQQKKPDLARKEFLDAIREQPKSPKAHSYFGQYLANTEKNFAAAFAEFETALKVDPGYMPTFYHLGRTAAVADTNLARGEESLKKYLAYMPKENEPAPANAHYYLGAVYEHEGKKVEAKQSYLMALKLNPTLKGLAEALKRVS